MKKQSLTLEVANRLAVITFHRADKKNAFNIEMYNELTKMLNDVSKREDVTITAITGSGDFYSSGNDLSTAFMNVDDIETAIDASVERVRKFVEAFICHKKILVAVVNGPAVGIAVTTLPLCDVVYCTPNAWFQTPFTKLGICAEAASSYTFPKIFGTSKANDLLLFNKRMSAAEALTSGLVSKVVEPENLEITVWKELRKNAAELSPKSLETSKQLIRRFDESKLHDANMNECHQLSRLFRTEEAQQALLNFVSKARRSHL